MTRRERSLLLAFLAAFFLLATVYNAISTPFEAPDEMGHFYYVVHLLRARQLPTLPPPYPLPHYEQEGSQAPLYYLGGAALVHILQQPLGLDMPDERLPFVFNPHSVCGQPEARYNVAWLAHDAHAEHFPYTGRVRVLHLLRLYSSLLATATVAGVFGIARQVFPDRPRAAWLAAALTALTPEFLFTAGAVNNDNMITLAATWGVYVALRILTEGISWPRVAALGLLSGLAALSKLGGLLLLPLGGCVLCVTAYLRRPPANLRRHIFITLAQLAVFGGLAAIVAGWWYLHNWQLYGDPTATNAHLAAYPGRSAMSWAIFFRELPGLFLSWWGVFGCTFPPVGFYAFCALLTLGGLAGLIAARRELRRPQMLVLLLWAVLMGIGYVRWNWITHAAKGRLLYPMIAVVAALLGRGWETWAARWPWIGRGLVGALALVALALPFAVMAPPVAPPPTYADAAVTPQVALVGRFGDAIALPGYDLAARSFDPGDTLDLTLYWQATAPLDRHYSLAVQLVSARPGDTTTRLNFNTWPGGGNAPTGFWQPGEVIADRYRLEIPTADAPTQAWTLQVAFYDLATGARLPFAPTGDAAPLTLVRVGGAAPDLLAESALAAPVNFGQAITLEGMSLAIDGDTATLDLWWQCNAPLPADLVTFIHFYDAGGAQVLTADGPPLAGGFPTSLWQPGDRIHDTRTLTLPQDAAAPLKLGVGWYNSVTGERLPAADAGGALPDAAVYRIVE